MGGAISGLFGGGPKVPKVQPAPPPPINNEADIVKREAAAEEERRRRLSAGRQSTNYTSGIGDDSSANASAKSLLG